MIRRYDLDWLRVGVFALLIFYHVGMFFVPWGWHIKNNVIYEWPTYPMLFINQWRLPILFIISGMGTYYALGKRSGKQFASERIRRLYIPLAFGMLLIVPPQVYLERVVNGQFEGHFFSFWPRHAFTWIYPEGNLSWHHLWFLPYLLVYSLILLPIFLRLRNNPQNSLLLWIQKRIKKPFGLFLFLPPLYLVEAFMEPFFPVTHALVDDWFTFVNYLLFFFFGFVLISVQEVFWNTVERHRRYYLYCGILGFSVWLCIRLLLEDTTLVHFTEAFVKVFNLWSWILVLFGYAATYLNKRSKLLSYCNQAVYPFYILHQTLTIIIGYYVMDVSWPLFTKIIVMSVGTFGGCWLLYEFLIRKWKVTRLLFGLKPKLQ
ncbi:acyltransferase family protein [Ulvibacterium marinum]|uniref:acyltransferase family protein n=1 Tax=Ulvibacterium marinum TaxID=2419782 RepID=UPI002493E1D6|nr:acyltransferase family protein [Ulvibacterium marinum]